MGRAKDIRAESSPGITAIGRLQDALASHRERAVIQVARSCVDGVVVGGVDSNRVDRCRPNQRIIGRHGPGGGVTAAIGRFPYTAAERCLIGHYAAIGGCRWIDDDPVHAARSGCVVKAARTAGHALRLRAESGKVGNAKGIRISKVDLEMPSKWDATWHARMLPGGRAHPCGIEAPVGNVRRSNQYCSNCAKLAASSRVLAPGTGM